jgi:hypothetical protein
MRLGPGIFRVLSTIFFLFILQFTLSQAGYAASFPCTTSTLILSAQNGSSGNPSTWVGGSVPSDGNCVVIRHHVTLSNNMGTEGGTGMGWIRIENGGILDSDCASPHAVYFGSTGTNPTGAGTSNNPGANASMFGFFVSFGTLNLSCAAPSNITLTSANEESPWYIHHTYGDDVGCTAISDNLCNGTSGYNGAVLNLQNTIASHLGTDVAYFNGIDWDMQADMTPPNSVTISNNHITDLYQIVAAGSPTQTGNWRIATNWFNTPRPNPAQGLIYFNGPQPNGWQITDNTVTDSQTASFLVQAPDGASQSQIMRNAVLGSASTQFSVVGINAGQGNQIEFNLCVNPEPPAATLNPCVYIGATGEDNTTNVSFNVMQGGHSGISQIGEDTQFSPTFSFNWISQWQEDYQAQGAIITRSGTITETYNVLVIENSSGNEYMIGDLAYSDTEGSCGASVHQDHNTIYGVANPTGNPSSNFAWGDGGTSPHTCVVNSNARTNISPGANQGYVNNNNDDGWDLSQGIEYGGAAVHHNLNYGETDSAYVNTQTTAGFDNGVVHHPSYSQYGDLSVNPEFVNPTRRPAGFDELCGGPGTDISLFANLARRSGFGGIYNTCYSIPALWSWIRLGWAPVNSQLSHAAHDGTYIGAVQPIGEQP